MESRFSFKDLEKVTLKTTYNMKVGDREILPGEVIARFDKIQLANFQEVVSTVTANGGFDNRAHVYWTTSQAIRLAFGQGVFSKDQLSVLTNAKLIGPAQSTSVEITESELLESDETCQIKLSHLPKRDLFIYDEGTGEKISNFTQEGKIILIEDPYKEVVVNYVYEYTNESVEYCFGQNLAKGFLELEGRTRIKDDVTGRVVTGIIKIPKLRLMSDLSIRLGLDASPVVGNFKAEAVPVGSRGNSCVSEFFILSDDIDSDL